MLRRYAVGQDDEAVEVEGYRRDPKSIGNSVTTPKDLICREDVLLIATLMAEKVAARLRGAEMRAGGVCVSIDRLGAADRDTTGRDGSIGLVAPDCSDGRKSVGQII